MSSKNEIKREIQDDISKIKDIIKKSDYGTMRNLHMELDGKYQSKIENWGLSQYGWRAQNGFIYNYIDKEAMMHNLQNMIGKLEGYKQELDLKTSIPSVSNANDKSKNKIPVSTNINFYNKNENNISNNTTNINFSTIENQIKDCESLTEEETKEALKKLNELQKIYELSESRKTKWEKAKNILVWVADKSVDVAIAYFPVIMSILSSK